jgi:hypothetical protein
MLLGKSFSQRKAVFPAGERLARRGSCLSNKKAPEPSINPVNGRESQLSSGKPFSGQKKRIYRQLPTRNGGKRLYRQ